jgi:protocatechuate 3,4-dioxygenase beta subunit
MALVGCDGDLPTANSSDAGDGSVARECTSLPPEIIGPYPADGSNGINALNLSGIVRSDIRPSLAGASGVAAGVPMRLTLTVVSPLCAPRSGMAIYLWHCDRDGNYSMYSPAAVSENYLRGVQQTDGRGRAIFTSIFPGCYPGRWPHLHLEVYSSTAEAVGGGTRLLISQLAMPIAACHVAYAAPGYQTSATSLNSVALDTDISFSDGADLQIPTVRGTINDGFDASLSITV